MNYSLNLSWTYGPTFIRNPCFWEGPVGNSESRTGFTRNPINGVPSANERSERRELQIMDIIIYKYCSGVQNYVVNPSPQLYVP